MSATKARTPEEMRAWSPLNRAKKYPHSRKVRAALGLRGPITPPKATYFAIPKRVKRVGTRVVDLLGNFNKGQRMAINRARAGTLLGTLGRLFQRKAV